MRNYIIVHGSFSSPGANWFGWLREYLHNRGEDVVCPQFPIAADQNYFNWSCVMDKLSVTEDTVIIGHSIAPIFAVKYLLDRKMKVAKLVSVCGFNGITGNKEYDEVNKTFFLSDDELKSDSRNIAKERICIYSDNDPYVPQDLLQGFAKDIVSKRIVLKGAGHINSESGFTELPLLREYIG